RLTRDRVITYDAGAESKRRPDGWELRLSGGVEESMGTTTFAATKLTIPTSVRAVVARPDLVEQLDQAWYRIGLVSAPAGFGKTALLAMWADSRRDSVAWLSCDVTDAEPTRFW